MLSTKNSDKGTVLLSPSSITQLGDKRTVPLSAPLSATIVFSSQIKMATEVAILGRGEFCKVVGEGLYTRFITQY